MAYADIPANSHIYMPANPHTYTQHKNNTTNRHPAKAHSASEHKCMHVPQFLCTKKILYTKCMHVPQFLYTKWRQTCSWLPRFRVDGAGSYRSCSFAHLAVRLSNLRKCMYTYIHVAYIIHLHIHISVCMYVYIYIYIHIHIYIYFDTCIYLYIYILQVHNTYT